MGEEDVEAWGVDGDDCDQKVLVPGADDLLSFAQRQEHHGELASHAHWVQDEEQVVSEPGEQGCWVAPGGDVLRVVEVSDDFGDGPGQAEGDVAPVGAGWGARQGLEDAEHDEQARRDLRDGGEERGLDDAGRRVEHLDDGEGLDNGGEVGCFGEEHRLADAQAQEDGVEEHHEPQDRAELVVQDEVVHCWVLGEK